MMTWESFHSVNLSFLLTTRDTSHDLRPAKVCLPIFLSHGPEFRVMFTPNCIVFLALSRNRALDHVSLCYLDLNKFKCDSTCNPNPKDEVHPSRLTRRVYRATSLQGIVLCASFDFHPGFVEGIYDIFRKRPPFAIWRTNSYRPGYQRGKKDSSFRTCP